MLHFFSNRSLGNHRIGNRKWSWKLAPNRGSVLPTDAGERSSLPSKEDSFWPGSLPFGSATANSMSGETGAKLPIWAEALMGSREWDGKVSICDFAPGICKLFFSHGVLSSFGRDLLFSSKFCEMFPGPN